VPFPVPGAVWPAPDLVGGLQQSLQRGGGTVLGAHDADQSPTRSGTSPLAPDSAERDVWRTTGWNRL
jgi:hypothetical protein